MITRRQFLVGTAAGLMALTATSIVHAANRKFVFKIKTRSGSIVGNIVINATDMDAAKHKLRKRYFDCEIMEAKEK